MTSNSQHRANSLAEETPAEIIRHMVENADQLTEDSAEQLVAISNDLKVLKVVLNSKAQEIIRRNDGEWDEAIRYIKEEW